MGGLLIRAGVNFIAVLVAATVIPDYVRFTTLTGVLVFAVILALLNTFVKPLLTLMTAPISCLTLGLFVLVINALLFWLGTLLTNGAVQVEGPIGALLGSLIVSAVSFLIARLT